MISCICRAWLFVTPWTVVHQAPQSVGFSKQDYWSRLPFPCPGDLPDLGIEPESPALADGFLTTSASSPQVPEAWTGCPMRCGWQWCGWRETCCPGSKHVSCPLMSLSSIPTWVFMINEPCLSASCSLNHLLPPQVSQSSYIIQVTGNIWNTYILWWSSNGDFFSPISCFLVGLLL